MVVSVVQIRTESGAGIKNVVSRFVINGEINLPRLPDSSKVSSAHAPIRTSYIFRSNIVLFDTDSSIYQFMYKIGKSLAYTSSPPEISGYQPDRTGLFRKVSFFDQSLMPTGFK